MRKACYRRQNPFFRENVVYQRHTPCESGFPLLRTFRSRMSTSRSRHCHQRCHPFSPLLSSLCPLLQARRQPSRIILCQPLKTQILGKYGFVNVATLFPPLLRALCRSTPVNVPIQTLPPF